MFIKTCIYNNNNKKKNREYKYTCSRLNNKLHYAMKWWVVNFSFHKKGGNNQNPLDCMVHMFVFKKKKNINL